MARYKLKNLNGFTLIEVMIAMSIFVIFTGILIGSYTSIVRSQREANDYRVLYSTARQVFDSVIDEMRNDAVYYEPGAQYRYGVETLKLISKDGAKIVQFKKDAENFAFAYCFDDGAKTDHYYLNPKDVTLSDLRFFISPAADPYNPANVANDKIQFQPKVTIYAKFKKILMSGKEYTVDFQTTVSSRFYATMPQISGTCNFISFDNLDY